MAVAQELQELVQLQQQELQRLQELPAPLSHLPAAPAGRHAAATTTTWHSPASTQLEVANAELRQQLQGTTSRLHDMEAAMAKLMDQQVRGACRTNCSSCKACECVCASLDELQCD